MAFFLLLVLLCGVVAVLNPRFISPENIQNVTRLIGLYGIFSIGLGLVIITGGIDLSVGSMMALLGVLLAMMLTQWHWAAGVALFAVLGLGLALGLLHGLLVTRVNLQPFVVTLCGLLFYRGLARVISEDETKGFGSGEGFETLRDSATSSIGPVPMPFILLLIISALSRRAAAPLGLWALSFRGRA